MNRTDLNMDLQVGNHGDYFIESYEGKVTILSYEGEQEVVRIPFVIAGYPVVLIEKFAFIREHNLVSIELPVNITEIDGEAFPTDVKIERYFNREMEGFEHESHWITDPYLDETGRFNVNPLDYYGLKVVDSHNSIETDKQTTLKPQCQKEEYVNVERRTIQSPADAYSMFDYLKYEKQEQFVVAFLNDKNQQIGITCVLKGNLNSSILHPREVFRLAVHKAASSIIVAQLQLSDNLIPSTEIIKYTNLLMECGELLGIKLLDSIIVSERKYISLKQKMYI